MRTIVINISNFGEVKIDAQCFKGSNCEKATEQIETVLGGKTEKKKTKKPEYYSKTVIESKLTF